MTDEEMKAAVAKRNEELAERLSKTAYHGCRQALDSALANVDYFVSQGNFNIGGARHWVVQARNELDQMHKALIAADRVDQGAKNQGG